VGCSVGGAADVFFPRGHCLRKRPGNVHSRNQVSACRPDLPGGWFIFLLFLTWNTDLSGLKNCTFRSSWLCPRSYLGAIGSARHGREGGRLRARDEPHHLRSGDHHARIVLYPRPVYGGPVAASATENAMSILQPSQYRQKMNAALAGSGPRTAAQAQAHYGCVEHGRFGNYQGYALFNGMNYRASGLQSYARAAPGSCK